MTTPPGLARFLTAVTSGTLLSAHHTQAMLDTQPADRGRGYGYGIYQVTLPGGSTGYRHRGSLPGFHCLAWPP